MTASRGLPADSPRPPDGSRSPSPLLALLDISEVATALRVSNMTVYRLIHDGRLPASRVGRSFRVERSDLDAYLDVSYLPALGEVREPGQYDSIARPSGV